MAKLVFFPCLLVPAPTLAKEVKGKVKRGCRFIDVSLINFQCWDNYFFRDATWDLVCLERTVGKWTEIPL
jgi:hypothetical protein